MNVLSNLTIKNLRLNKVRSIVTLIGIILSTALLVALCGLCSSVLCSMEQMCIANKGQQHIVFYDVPKEEVGTILHHKETAHAYMVQQVDRYALEDNDDNESTIIAMDKHALQENANKIVVGRLPENSSEILLSDDYMYEDIPVGESIKLLDGKMYEVVGKINQYAMKPDPYEYPIIQYMEESTGDTNIAVTYKHPKEYEEITESIVGKNIKYGYSYNSELLRYQAYAVSDSTMMMVYSMGIIVAIIIMLTSVFCIRNSFAISITEKIRQYGMLASVGATPRQIRKNVLFEGSVLGMIGIPLGVGSGMLAAMILVNLSNYLLASAVTDESMLVFRIHPVFIGVAILLAIITIYCSCISSAIHASRISEIEAIRSTQDIKLSARKMKTPKYISRILGVGGVFAYKNMKRNKRKFRTTTISLIVSIATFIALSSFLELGFAISDSQYIEFGYNLIVDGEDTEEVWNHISEIDSTGEIKEKNYMQMYQIYCQTDHELDQESNASEFYLYVLDESYYQQYLKQQSIGYDEDMVILLDQTYVTTEEGKKKVEDYIKDKEKITIAYDLEEKQQIALSYIRPQEYPMGIVKMHGMGIVMSQSQFEKYAQDQIQDQMIYNTVCLNATEAYQLEKSILEYKDTNNLMITPFNMDEMVKAQDNMLLLTGIFLYGFITVIMLVGLTNIFNSLSTNMNLRRKEFATLQSIGMTSKELERMITLESTSYVAKALAWGIPLGILGGFALYRASTYGDVVYAFVLPWKQIVGAAVVVFVVVYGIMKKSLSKIAKQNIIETIRQENI